MSLTEPLRFLPQPLPKVWGGRRLDSILPGGLGVDGPVGEVWELADREGAISEVAHGTYAGRNLAGLMLSERESLLGEVAPSEDGRFPLLIKYLDADQPLSVQVHPDAKTARRLGGEAKDECWYVLAAEPGAVIYVGLKPGVDAAEFASNVASHHLLDLLQQFEVRAGDFISLPAGTIHSLGAGVTLVEVQENADTTYRLFDWDRPGLDGEPRELHLEEGLQAIDYERPTSEPVRAVFEGGVNSAAPLVDGPRFGVDLLRLHEPEAHDNQGRPWAYVVLAGRGSLATEAGSWRIRRGETWLLPATVGAHRFEAADGELEVLRVEGR